MKWRVGWSLLRKTAHLMVGVPDYDDYVKHCQCHHPDTPIMTREQWFRELQARRYGAKGPKRCC